MSNNKDRAKKLKSARYWLASAESSLIAENSIEGDLKLMLAKAELASLSESRQGVWRKAFASLCLVLGLAIALYLGSQPTDKITQMSKTQVSNALDPKLALDDKAEAINSQATISETIPIATSDNKLSGSESEINVNINSNTNANVMRASQNTPKHIIIDTIKQSKTEINITESAELSDKPLPTSDMQQLMQLAGKALRE